MTHHLRIVAINDVYSLDNLPRLATLVAAARTGVDRLLVTVAGDFLAPSVLSSLDNGRGMVACLDAIGATHVTFGNHEDDVPHAELRARMRELKAAWLAANVHDLPGVRASDVVELGDVRIGIFGIVLVDPLIYRRPPFGATVEEPLAAAVREVKLLVAGGCAWVVALTHQTAEADRELAVAFAGLPVLVLGGHEHTALDETVAGTRILKAGCDASSAIVVDAVFGDGPPAVTARIEPVRGYAEDPTVRALVDHHMAPVRALAGATLLDIPAGTTLSSIGTRARQTSIGALVCTRLRDVLGADACVFNGGGIRAARDYTGRFTYGDLEAEVPFDNELVVASLPGRVLEDAIRASRADAPVERGSYLQVDDGIVVVDGEVTRVAGAPLDPNRVYGVALVRDLCFGLDHIAPLVDYARANPAAVPPSGNHRTPKEVLVRSFAVDLWKRLGGFDALDANRDGRVAPAEVAAAVAELGPAAHIVGELVVHALDTDHDDSVSRTEAGCDTVKR